MANTHEAAGRPRRGALWTVSPELELTPDEVIDRLLEPADGDSGPIRLQIIPGDTVWKVRDRLRDLGITPDLLLFDSDGPQLVV